METGENQKEENNSRCPEDGQHSMKAQSDSPDLDPDQKRQRDLYLGCLSKQHLIMISLAVGLVVMVIIIAVIITKNTGADLPLFPTGGDMLDFLVQSGDINKPDGLLATWFHRANSKEEMNKALTSDVMILEADVTLEGYGTQDEKPVPIMAHPPDISSDNTLDQWLDAVLASRKGIKLDFKSLASVGLSLDLLRQKNSSKGINRPVWLNADILRGPNVPNFVHAVNGSRFLQLIEEKFPDVTLSPGWMVLYLPPLFNSTYSRTMMEDMYNVIKDVPQKVTFPVHALLVRRGWQHVSWLLSQSPRFSLTLWQGSDHPSISDLLFVRDNSHPARVYYDIYEPTLSEFKQAARKQGCLRRFYPGGNLMDFLFPAHTSDTNFLSAARQGDSLAVRWFTVADEASLLDRLSGGHDGMLVLHVVSDISQLQVPVIRTSGRNSEALTLQHVLQLLGKNAHVPVGVYLRVHSLQLLEASLYLLQSAYTAEDLYRPVWISVEGLQSNPIIHDFISRVESLFPYVTLVLTEQTWPPLIPAAVTSLSQRVALHLNAASSLEGLKELRSLMDRCDVVVEVDTNNRPGTFTVLKELLTQQTGTTNTHLYLISD